MPNRPKSGWNIRRSTTHPGEMLLEEFMLPLSVSQNRFATDLRVPPGRINQIINGKRAIKSDTALRLAKYFGNSPEFWLNLQQMYDLSKTRTEHGKQIEQEVRPAEDCLRTKHKNRSIHEKVMLCSRKQRRVGVRRIRVKQLRLARRKRSAVFTSAALGLF